MFVSFLKACLIFASLICVYPRLLAPDIFAQALPAAAPQTVGMNAAKLNQIDALVEADIASKKLPGAVVLVAHRGKIVYRKAFGNRSLVPTVEKMTIDTIFDVASLTKPVATATSIMMLVEQGKLRLGDAVGKFIPEIQDEQAKRVTIQQLLTHTSGYAPDFDLREQWTGRDGMLAALYKEELRNPPGTKFVYSDIGFIVLGEIIQRITQTPLFKFADEQIFKPTAMLTSGFFTAGNLSTIENNASKLPTAKLARISATLLSRTAPTENIRGQNSYLGGKFDGAAAAGDEVLRGQVHDPTAFRMGGVAGHAGLFSTADDLARFCQMLLNGGAVTARPDGNRVLSAQTIARMTAPYVVSETGEARGLGWDINTGFSSNRGELFPMGSFGHTGFTGTSVWIDRVSQTFVIFLSNRVHPDGKGDVTPLRAKIATVVASAIEDAPIETYRLAEAAYQSQVAPQIPKFKEQADAARRAASLAAPRGGIDRLTGGKAAAPTVLNGIDVLARDGFKQLARMKVGLVTNQTGRDINGKSTIDVLNEADNVKLVALFSPEHGIRGELDQAKIEDAKDEKTGLPLYSLYGETRRPKPQQLDGLDAIVYDIQDVGARFYTYTTTLRNVLEEAAKSKKPVFVLDRPNPINGTAVEGPVADEESLSFTAAHTIPVRYGMTIGELAQMMNAERKIGADLRVIRMENWSRSMWFDETGQAWINPSPNMRSLTEATLYPGIGLLETTNISVGRGTDTPFEVVGAPWIDGKRLAAYLNGRNLPGVRFVPVRFTPTASVFKGETLGGINIIVTGRSMFEPVRTGVEIAAALRDLFGSNWQIDKFARLVASKEWFGNFTRGKAPESLSEGVAAALSDFNRRRSFYLLYK